MSDGTLKYVYWLGLTYAVDDSGNVQVYPADGLGSPRTTTDAGGTVIHWYQTDKFGIPTQMITLQAVGNSTATGPH